MLFVGFNKMNKCFLVGKVISEPTYKFLYRNKNVSICYFKLKSDNIEIMAFGIDEVADRLFRNIKVNQLQCFYGSIRNTINKVATLEVQIYEKISFYNKNKGAKNGKANGNSTYSDKENTKNIMKIIDYISKLDLDEISPKDAYNILEKLNTKCKSYFFD